MVIQAWTKRGVYQRDIAETLGVHPKTVQRALTRRGASPPRPPRRPSLLDGYRAEVDRRLGEGVWNGVVIFRELQVQGDRGRLSILRDDIRPKRARRPGRATVRFETAPGPQRQSDWGEIETVIGGQATVVHVRVNTLGDSRRFHFWGTTCEDAEHTDEGLIRSFEWFDGVAAEVLVDNQQCAVLAHPRPGATCNPRVVDVAERYGFVPRACRPARARTKGKDERMVGYVKHHVVVRDRAVDSWDHLTQQAEQWLREEADPRVHGPVHEVVTERFAREAPTLRPLPAQRYDTSYWESRQVSWESDIEVRGNRYSVPAPLVGHRVQRADHPRRRGAHLRRRDPRRGASAPARHPGVGDRPGPSHGAVAAGPRGRTPAARGLRGGGVMQRASLLDRLKMEHLQAQLDPICEQASKADLDYQAFLAQALDVEWRGRYQHGVERRLKQARFPWVKTVDQVDVAFQPSIDRTVIRELAGLSFLERTEHVVLLGPPGVGKTHLGIALGVKAVEAGFSVLLLTVETLMTRHERARHEHRLERTLQQLVYPCLLILDALGSLPLSREEASLFFRRLVRRYERASLIVTSHKSFGDWGDVFNDQVLATAILDRLLHPATTVNITGESSRLREKKKAGLLGRRTNAATADAEASA